VRRVLFLAYHFPPIGGAGVQRNVKFVRYLPEFGWEPVVVTRPGPTADRWSPVDETLAAEVPTQTTVARVSGSAPGLSRGWRRRSERWLARESPLGRWWREGAASAGLESVDGVELVYASMAPWQSGDAAAALSKALGVPWVADLRDPWALDEMVVYPTAAHRRYALRRMRRLLALADAVVMNTPEAAARVGRFPELRDKPIEAIPNGFDASDFAGAPPPRTDQTFRIVHAGYLHSELASGSALTALVRELLGGAVRGVNILARSHAYLLQALDQLLQARPKLESMIELHLAGVLSERDRELARRTFVSVNGYLSHADAVALIRSADLLFLPMHDLPPGKRATIVPGKTYEYLASGRPILAAVPDGDARDLLTAARSARLARPAESSRMAELIEAEVERWQAGTPVPEPGHDLLRRYERRRLTGDLARVFDGLAAGD
jgi:glycosyltransferase involved in cell wall biosynthesis